MSEWPSAPKRDNPEERLQQAVVQHLIMRGTKNTIWYHPANGGLRSKRTAARMKMMGVVAGVPDLAVVLPDGRAAYMEFKGPVGRLSPAQKAFQDKCSAMEVEHAVVSSLDTALDILKSWKVIV